MHMTIVSGPGSVRGEQHGQERATLIAATAGALRAHLAEAGHSPDDLGQRLAASQLCQVAQELTPDLWAEVVGIAAGSGIPQEDVLLLTFLDEVWAFTGGAGCSAIARDREIGQTMDLPAWTAGRLLVLRTSSGESPTSLVMSYPGMVGLCGANAAGLGVAVNALEQFPLDENGLGVAFITRHLLTLPTLAEAADVLARIPHAAGQAYTISGPDGLATFEAAPGHLVRVTVPGTRCAIHTNHPIGQGVTGDESSRVRLASLERSLADDASITDALSDDVVLDGHRYGSTTSTFAAFHAVLGTDDVHFIDGDDLRAGSQDWTAISFR